MIEEEVNLSAKHDSECGVYEKNFAITAGCVVVDLGAHVGYFSALACDKGAFVIAFEPHPVNFKWLNRRLVGRQAIAINKAASNRTGLAILYQCDENSGAHSLYRHGLCSGVEHEVGCLDIGQFLKTTGIRPDFIKIDTESSEYDILESLFEAGIKVNMAIEAHDSTLYFRCKAIAERNGMKWLPRESHIGVCYCLP